MQKIRIGLIGFGVVGSGVVKILQQNQKLLQRKTGIKIELAALADLDLKSKRGVKVDPKILTTDGLKICRDPNIDLIIETVGGLGFAAQVIATALQNDKHVITANKALLAEKGAQLFDLAQKRQKQLLFEAAVGGAIPIVRTLKTSLAGEQITKITGILNGTSNFILTKLAQGGREFQTVLQEAQKLGFAEADPTLDLSGGDAAHKIALIARLAFDNQIPFSQIFVEGITKLASADFEFAKLLHHKIKLIALAKRHPNALEIRVNPTLLPEKSPLAKIDGVTNAVSFSSKNLGEITLAGPGAGSLPTATAIISDLLEVSQIIFSAKITKPAKTPFFQKLPLQKIEAVPSEYYLRFLVRDKPGVIATISKILAKYSLGIRDILQLDLKEFKKAVPLAIILHPAIEKNVRAALQAIEQAHCIQKSPVCLHVETDF